MLRIVLVVLLAAALGIAQSATNVKIVPVSRTSPANGEQMYKNYCAACHGLDGKGDGPAAPAFHVRPANLSTIAARNNGSFPELQVLHSISGEDAIPAHGTPEMPVWGTVLKSLDPNPSLVKLRLSNLTDHIKTLQKK